MKDSEFKLWVNYISQTYSSGYGLSISYVEWLKTNKK